MEAVILIYFLLNLYAGLSGIKEAILYSMKGSQAFYFNEHILFVVERILVLSLLPLSMYLEKADLPVIALTCLLSFPFWHDGFYYEARRRIDVPYYRFYSDSTTSTARFEILWELRLTGKITSVIGIVLYLIFLK